MEPNDILFQAQMMELKTQETALLSRMRLTSQLGKAFGGDRDYYETLGYNKNPDIHEYYRRFERQDIAYRIVTAYPDATWRLPPRVYEDDTENKTAFETDWETLKKRLQLDRHFYRADVLACLGRFSILFLGFNDVTSLDGLKDPVARRNTTSLQYVSEYSERHVEVDTVDTNIMSPRFGLPLIYEITFDRGDEEQRKKAINPFAKTFVHWERVIHIADDIVEGELYGTPKLKKVFNLLDDLIKVVGGSAETYWRNARKDLIIQINEGAHLDKDQKDILREKTEEYVHNINRVLGLENAEAKSLPVEIASPEGHFAVLQSMFAGATGIPKRELFGSEMGELASSQDRANLAAKIISRQLNFAEPTVMRNFIDRLIDTRVMATPKQGTDGYTLEWPNPLTESANEEAERASKWATTLDTLTRGQTLAFFPLREIRADLFKWKEETEYDFDDELEAKEAEKAEAEAAAAAALESPEEESEEEETEEEPPEESDA